MDVGEAFGYHSHMGLGAQEILGILNKNHVGFCPTVSTFGHIEHIHYP